jgi:thiamine biosynthesis protein ThiS|tara:strand:- start:79 stop:297 length:219 start_codon:yes stop_codon:yes gene_type:complete
MNNLKKIKIQLNGKKHQIKMGCNIQNLLKILKKDNNKVAVELNGEIADKNKYSKIYLNKNDKIEIVQFIGGG